MACLAASALASAVAPPPPNVILITLDTVRADRMGFLGSKRGLTPNLDALARQSIVFTRAYSQVPLTAPSHATILTGTYPQFHQVSDFQVPLAKELPYAPAILGAQGYHTAAFVGAMVLDPSSDFAPGFERGFDTYDAGFRTRYHGDDRYRTTERRGGEVVAHALAWLDHAGLNQAGSKPAGLKQSPRGPFFLWVHLYDAHHPYDPPQPYKSKYASAPYDGEIAYVDSIVEKLLSQLRARGLYEGSIIAVMADHGEALGEHGEDTHGIFLYDETIHVPLLIKLPGDAGKQSAGKRIETRVGLVDVLPTILQAASVAVPREVQGESLLDLMQATATPTPASAQADRPAYAETDYPHRAYRWSSLRAWRTGKYLYVQAPRPELYDQAADPKSERDLSAVAAAVTSTLAGQLQAFRQKTSNTKEAPQSVVDPAAQEKLAALGYMATDPNATKPGSKDLGADPKDKIDIANLSSRANFLVEEERYPAAVPLLEQLIAKDAGAPVPYSQLGRSYVAMREYGKAVPVLRKVVELNPNSATPHFQLGVALLASENVAAAVPELEIALDKAPHWDEAHLLLANAYAQTDRTREAIIECEKVLEGDPDNYAALLFEGRVLILTKHADTALPRLEKASELAPDAPEPHQYLADAYGQLGQKKEAARQQFLAKRLATNH
jgi:arylsulfatase A-like enzyme/cytochrome c-type biogenesis protein CcmH/NrfG